MCSLHPLLNTNKHSQAVKDIGFPAQLFQELQQVVAAVIYTGQVRLTKYNALMFPLSCDKRLYV